MPRHKEIGFLGPEGTFSHLLARRRFGDKIDYVAKPNLEAVFDFLLHHHDVLALVPVENSSGGVISDTIDLLIEHAGNVRVCEELALDVRPALIGIKGRQIHTIYSHFAPLRHYRHWIKESFPQAEIITASSTAQAAQDAKADLHGAAISAPGAAELYGLDILKFPILPNAVNITHFYILGNPDVRTKSTKRTKTALVAALKDDQCGILHKLLGPFARGKINLKRIVSRPISGRPETYVFFIEIEGSTEDVAVAKAIQQATRYCEKLTNLGSYPAGKKFTS